METLHKTTNSKQHLVDSMKHLLWQQGYDATSPNMVLEDSKLGKGSFYHHFRSKKALAIAAMDNRTDELIAEFNQIFDSTLPWTVKLEQFFALHRDTTVGCKVGRSVLDPSMDEELLQPSKRYFVHIAKGIENTLQQAKDKGELQAINDLQAISLTIVSLIQGGFILSKSLDEKRALSVAAKGIMDLLRLVK